MSTHIAPEVGDWYKTVEGLSFEVIAVDEDDGNIEIQYFDGAVEEVETGSWYEMELEQREPPEDWSGPFDDLIADDLGDTEEARHPLNWSGPLDTMEWEE